ncbi:unnamed protein product [marine sediment metagenome]|uniref:Uncharacterized protein n=1 Tax=marine sediment metagenome TaxID=412755 RepID=X1U7Y2_9ZZZZ
MEKDLFVEVHNAADRVALEAARDVKEEGQEDRYIAVYGKVSGYLVGVFDKADIDD